MMPRRYDFTGRKVTIVGLGREGTALAEFFGRRGADVTVSDNRPEDQLGPNIDRLHGLRVRYSLGENRTEDLLQADEVYLSPGLPPGLPAVEAARAAGIPIRSETQLFFELCPAPIVGVTGSSGKSTTTSLIGHILEADGRHVIVGGNIGRTVIDRLGEVTRDSWVVMELSSFQLERLTQSPHIAVITNLTPNHLDVHGTMDAYREAKRQILAWQNALDFAVLNRDDPGSEPYREAVKARLVEFSRRDAVGLGAFVYADAIWIRSTTDQRWILDVREIPLRGSHNVDNVLAAVAATAIGCGVRDERIADAIRSFKALPHRLELVRTVDGVRYINDSIATSPERTLAALRAIREPIVLLLGGRDKKLPVGELVAEASERCRAVITFGEAGPMFEQAFREHGVVSGVERVDRLAAAVQRAAATAEPGDVVLLSPACTSFDEFRDFEARGESFRRLVEELYE